MDVGPATTAHFAGFDSLKRPRRSFSLTVFLARIHGIRANRFLPQGVSACVVIPAFAPLVAEMSIAARLLRS